MAISEKGLGRRVVDIGQLVGVFEAQEGEIQHIIGKTGNGKTYEGTRRALEFLEQGYNVYTTWQLILPHYYDERYDRRKLFWRTVLFFKRFYRVDLKSNWHFLDIDRPDLIEYVAKLTDCVVIMDEGQDIFDSRERIDKKSRQVLTRMRHFRKTLIIISQRAQAVDVTARANVTFYFKCVKTRAWYWPFATYFKVYRTEEMDQQNFPIWEDLMTGWKAEVWRSGFASKKIYNAYNSWYLRAGIPRSQEVHFEAYDLSLWEKIKAFFSARPADTTKADIDEQVEQVRQRNEADYKKVTTFIDKKSKGVIHNQPIDTKKSMVSLSNEVRTDKKVKKVRTVRPNFHQDNPVRSEQGETRTLVIKKL